MYKHTTAIILAAGIGSRMKSATPKQYTHVFDYPVIYHTIKAFQESPIIKDIILVCGASEINMCQESVVDEYDFDKVVSIVAGGEERYHSVKAGLEQLSESSEYVMIHDCARPVVSQELLLRGYESVVTNNATIPVLPVKDTIKEIHTDGFVTATPNRQQLYIVQTPQVFGTALIKEAYANLKESSSITDDAMVVEKFTNKKVHTYEGDYRNIKITTPEDIGMVEMFLMSKIEKNTH